MTKSSPAEHTTSEHTSSDLTHLRSDGSAHMVDVTEKAVTKRTARAEAYVETRADVVDRLMTGDLPKGEALGTARIAGIMAAKRTAELIPLCHPLPLTKLAVDFEQHGDRVRVVASVTTRGVTGVEMEALTAVSVAALTLYDMIKAVDNRAVITGTRVLAKAGGKSGDWSIE
ncbi:cyclic pyranopterin monophosphate synthase MoaC [Leucobacter sp. USHLN153]|uniref:cyclic pyranopterin monophosphate synthase MoaC n=1 Tax=Leucobacter sp. USHLN153 TaxID=3081268 RepID=UPI00301B53E9